MVAEIKIIRNAPPPPERCSVRSRWPLGDMEPGDAFDAPEADRLRIASAVGQRKIRGIGVFTIRKIDDQTIRVWRVK